MFLWSFCNFFSSEYSNVSVPVLLSIPIFLKLSKISYYSFLHTCSFGALYKICDILMREKREKEGGDFIVYVYIQNLI